MISGRWFFSRVFRLSIVSFRFCRQFATRSNRNYYEILGVDRSASAIEIKKAFYTLSKKYHPDVVGAANKAANEKFLEVKEAYDVLRDEKKRHDYDQQLKGTSFHYNDSFGSYGYHQAHSQQQQQDYYRHVRRPPPNANNYSHDDFQRIWRNMQNNQEFQRATRDFNEYLKKARERMYEDYAKKREARYNAYSEEEHSKTPMGRARNEAHGRWKIVQQIFSVYIAIFGLAIIYQYLRKKPIAPYNDDLSLYPVNKSSYEKIQDMINRPPR